MSTAWIAGREAVSTDMPAVLEGIEQLGLSTDLGAGQGPCSLR